MNVTDPGHWTGLLCPLHLRHVADPHPVPGELLDHVRSPSDLCRLCEVYEKTSLTVVVGPRDWEFLSLWRVPIQRWVSASRADGYWWKEEPESHVIAADLTAEGATECAHGRSPCYAMCGVRHVHHQEDRREVEWRPARWHADWRSLLLDPGKTVTFMWNCSPHLRCRVRELDVRCTEPVDLRMVGHLYVSPGRYRTDERDPVFVLPGSPPVRPEPPLEGDPDAWRNCSILVEATNVGLRPANIQVTLVGDAVASGWWEPIPHDDRVGWFDRVHGFGPSRRDLEEAVCDAARIMLRYGVDMHLDDGVDTANVSEYLLRRGAT